FLLTLAWAKALAVLGVVLLLRGGLLTFGHALYYAVGAYTAGFAVKFLGVHEGLVVLVLAVVTGATTSALLGLLLARYRGVHFGLLNLAFSMVLYAILLKFYAVTGGTDGLRLPTPLLAGIKPPPQSLRLTIYYVTVVLAALLLYVAYRFTTSPLGYTLRAVRDNEVRVEYMGASVRQAIYCSYIVAGVMASVGGVLAGFSVGHIVPEVSFWTSRGSSSSWRCSAGRGACWRPSPAPSSSSSCATTPSNTP